MALNTRQAEFGIKTTRVRQLLAEKGLDALLLQRFSSIAWATCGADVHINTASSEGACALLITPDRQYLLTNTIEAARLEKEEGLGEQGWHFEVTPWYSAENRLSELIKGKRIGCDGLYTNGQDLSAELALLRAQLTEPEQERFRVLGKLCAESMDEAVRKVKPGMTEFQIAGLLSGAAESRGAQAVVDLIGTDERIFQYRHAIPTDKKQARYAMLVLCGRKWGLICSITRLVHFGPLPEEVELKMNAVAEVDAAMIAATRPGSALNSVFAEAQRAYAAQGYPDEWQLHHQGGLAGYEPREITATPDTRQPVFLGQAFAWNPSIKGAKSEDTILVGAQKNEIITAIEGWPMIEVKLGNAVFQRPAILVKY
jgi:antitoxin VapB